jgi:hypothetical protein
MVASGITKGLAIITIIHATDLMHSHASAGSAVIDSVKLWFFYLAFRHLAPKGVGEWTIKTDQQVLLRNYGTYILTWQREAIAVVAEVERTPAYIRCGAGEWGQLLVAGRLPCGHPAGAPGADLHL